MTLRANIIRINTSAPFPANVQGSGLVSISKTSGIWRVALNFAALAKVAVATDPANSYLLMWNSVTGAASMLAIAGAVASKVTKILNGSGAFASPYAALSSDDVLIVKQGAATPFTITIDWSQRTKPLTIVAGDLPANFANITVTPGAGQTQMATVNYSYVLDGPGQNITLTPLPDRSGAY